MIDLIREKCFSVVASFGRCPNCIRGAFLSAAAAWGIYVACLASFSSPEILFGAIVVCIALTSLWVAHVIGFVTRLVLSTLRASHARTAAIPPTFERRKLLGLITRAFALTVAISAMPSRAQTGCTTSSGTVYKPGETRQWCVSSTAAGCLFCKCQLCDQNSKWGGEYSCTCR